MVLTFLPFVVFLITMYNGGMFVLICSRFSLLFDFRTKPHKKSKDLDLYLESVWLEPHDLPPSSAEVRNERNYIFPHFYVPAWCGQGKF